MSFTMPNAIANGQTRDARPVQANFTAINDALQNDYLRADGSVAADSALTASAVPTAAGHLVNKGYADALIPVGSVLPYAGPTAPSALWALCVGQLKSKATNPLLWGLLGSTYGTATDTQFYLPNMQSRVPVGKGVDSWNNTLGQTGGGTDAFVVDHNHGLEISASTGGAGAHSHSGTGLIMAGKAGGFTNETQAADNGGNRAGDANVSIAAEGDHTHAFGYAGNTHNVVGGQSGSLGRLQPYLTLNFIIRLG